MEFEPSAHTRELQNRLADFIRERVDPADAVYRAQVRESGDPHFHPPVMEELKAEARERGLWNLFLPDSELGARLTTLEYAPLCELMGQSRLSQEATNCSAPDTGNMELLTKFATPFQRERFLGPLLDGTTRSCFAMTEPWVASSDASNISSRIERDGDHYVINAHKWFTSGALDPRCKFAILMGVTDPDADPYHRQSMIIVPLDSPGVTLVRGLTVFGHDEGPGHAETLFENVRLPKENLLGTEGSGFAIAQARLGPGRIHHCMRLIGMAERAVELMCRRALDRSTFGKPLAEQGVVQDWIAESRVRIEQARLLVLKAAWLMDTGGNKGAHTEIQAIKIITPVTVEWVIDKAIQAYGAAGVGQDTPLARLWTQARTLRLGGGPGRVHKRSLARRELARHRDGR